MPIHSKVETSEQCAWLRRFAAVQNLKEDEPMKNSSRIIGALTATLLLTGAALAQTRTTTTTTSQTITTEQAGKIRTYVQKEKKPSVKVQEQVTVGSTLPSTTQIYTFPEDVGVKNYRYSIINDRTVIVDPSSRRVIQVIE
jgi:hypothetical protein